MIGQFNGRKKTNVYGWVSDLAVARSGFNQIDCWEEGKSWLDFGDLGLIFKVTAAL